MSVMTSAPAEGAPNRKPSTAAEIVARSGLPAALGERVLAVTGKCRLWPSERRDVARELCGHFLDGLDAGESVDVLRDRFGDPARAASLITSARKRLRPRWWRASRLMLRGIGATFAAAVVGYLVLLARFYVPSPNISRNMLKELNATTETIPERERAWPLYVRARVEFGVLPSFMLEPDYSEPPRSPSDPYWSRMSAWLSEHQAALATVREAAAKPVVGLLYRSTMDPELGRAMELTNPGFRYEQAMERDVENPMVVGILLPHLAEMRRNARWLAVDARMAAARSDGATYLKDLEAMLQMASQTQREDLLISKMVGVAIAALAVSTIGDTVTDAGLLHDEQLRALAHRVAGFADGRIRANPADEVCMIDDFLQRYYSDDGHGSGHYIGSPEFDRLYDDWGMPKPKGMFLLRAVQPVISMTLPSRKEVRRRADLFVAAARADDGMPSWQHHLRTSDAMFSRLMEVTVYRVLPLLRSFGSTDRSGAIGCALMGRDQLEAARSATLVVIAMEAYRRAHGAWPERLDELVPAYLPAIPADPCTGEPLRFIPARDGRPPTLYSVGVDGVDDGGTLPKTTSVSAVRDLYWLHAEEDPVKRQLLHGGGAPSIKGDWILWPEAR